MTSLRIQNIKPNRSAVVPKAKYQEYREDLKTDFNSRCGYCDDADQYADKSCFHIDHFAPKSQFPDLELEYNNLVYSCRFCNIHKSYHWIGSDAAVPNDGNTGFIDPCCDTYSVNVLRDNHGKIYGDTNLGKYIVKRLHLHLLRHQYLWQARRLRELRDEAGLLIEKMAQNKFNKSDVFSELALRFVDLTKRIDEYEQLAAD